MSQTKCRILYVDDHEDSAHMFSLLLAGSDYELHNARSIEEALQMARESEFDLYVLDKHLPDGSGLELCKQLASLTPGVPCMIYSGDTYEIHRSEAIAAGARAYVPKPEIEQLIGTVHKLLSERECAMA
jgi:CheY-like chemotaxis protein